MRKGFKVSIVVELKGHRCGMSGFEEWWGVVDGGVVEEWWGSGGGLLMGEWWRNGGGVMKKWWKSGGGLWF